MTLDTTQIRARADAATEGPWERDELLDLLWQFGVPPENITPAMQEQFHRNMDFVQSARTDIPALCDEVDALRKRVAELEVDNECYVNSQELYHNAMVKAWELWKSKNPEKAIESHGAHATYPVLWDRIAELEAVVETHKYCVSDYQLMVRHLTQQIGNGERRIAELETENVRLTQWLVHIDNCCDPYGDKASAALEGQLAPPIEPNPIKKPLE
jgi:hypothetical protein